MNNALDERIIYKGWEYYTYQYFNLFSNSNNEGWSYDRSEILFFLNKELNLKQLCREFGSRELTGALDDVILIYKIRKKLPRFNLFSENETSYDVGGAYELPTQFSKIPDLTYKNGSWFIDY